MFEGKNSYEGFRREHDPYFKVSTCVEAEVSLFKVKGWFNADNELHSFSVNADRMFSVPNDAGDKGMKKFIDELKQLTIELEAWININKKDDDNDITELPQ